MSDCGGYGLPNSSACSSIMWELVNDSYNAEVYTGSVCRSYLLGWQECMIGPTDSGIVAINSSQNQTDTEKLAVESLQVLGKTVHEAQFLLNVRCFNGWSTHYILT